MTDQIRELAKWVIEYKANESKKIEGLSEIETYGKGVTSLFSFTPKFDGESPTYSVVQIDKELELYTLHEASNTDGVSDILKGMLNSPLIPESINKIEASLRANINSGLVIYAQPKISEEGELLEHNISIETTMPKSGASDVLIIIAKTGSRLNIVHKFVEGNDSSVLGRQTIILCEDGAMVKYKEGISNTKGALYLGYINLIGPASNVTFTGIANSDATIRMKAEYLLLGEGSNCLSEIIAIAKNGSKFDISNVANLKSDTSHAVLHAAAVSYDNSHVIYRDGIISSGETNGSVDEAKLLMVGDESRVDALPVKDNSAMRHVGQSHLDSASNVVLKQFFGRIIGTDVLDEATINIK